MTVRIDVTNKNGSTFSDNKVLSFNLQKDAYTPYGLLHIKLTGSTKDYSNAAEIKFRLGGFTPHYGLIDSITTEVSGNNKIVNIVSRSFTSLVCQNQIEPGTITNVSINDLMTNYYSFPHVTWERNSATSYIYVKPNSSMWDALVNLSYKICGSYPFIRGQNEPVTYKQDLQIIYRLIKNFYKVCVHLKKKLLNAKLNGKNRAIEDLFKVVRESEKQNKMFLIPLKLRLLLSLIAS